MRKIDYSKSYDDELNCWLEKREEKFIIGMTDWAQEYCGEISAVTFEVNVGDTIRKGSVVCFIESEKTLTEICTPVSGSVCSLNQDIIVKPGLLNDDCYDRGWLFQLSNCPDSEIYQLKSPQWYSASIDSFYRKGS